MFQITDDFNHMPQCFTRINFVLVNIKANTIVYDFPFNPIQAMEGKT